jgi:Holliday junction resolvasome RuvABC endonuclease subunit
MKRIVAGIDFSLSCPAMCVHSGNEWESSECRFYYLYNVSKWIRNDKNLTSQKFQPHITQEERLNWITSWFIERTIKEECTEVYIENYSYTSHSSSTHVLAEGCGLLKHKMWSHKIRFETLPVTTIKKFATGKGNSTKEGMCRAFLNEGTSLEAIMPCPLGKSPLADLVDAYFIAKMGFEKNK